MTQRQWKKTATGDWLSGDWRIRGPIMGHSMFWLYRRGSRYTPTGKFEDAVSFGSVWTAMSYVEGL